MTIRHSILISLLLLLSPLPLFASLRWDLVNDAPSGTIERLATDGTDLAVSVADTGINPARRVAIFTTDGWETYDVPNALWPGAIALSSTRLALAGMTVPLFADGMPPVLWMLDRATKAWTRVGDLPMGSRPDTPVALTFEGNGVLVLTSACRLLRWTGSAWETPGGWPTYGPQAECGSPFIRDGGRLFAVAGAVFDLTTGQVVYPTQPEGPERVGVAVDPGGPVFLQNGASYFAASLFLPGRSDALDVPPYSRGPLLHRARSFYAGSFAGLVRLGAGRWTVTRTAASPTGFVPRGPFVEVGGIVYSTNGSALIAGRDSTRLLLPVVVKGSGVAGASYRTELRLLNAGEVDVTVDLELRPPQGRSGGTARLTVPLAAGRAAVLQDLVESFRSLHPEAPTLGSVSLEFHGTQADEDVWAGADVVSDLHGLVSRTFVPTLPWGSGPSFFAESSLGFVPRSDPAVRTNIGWADGGDGGPDGPLQTPFRLTLTGLGSTYEFFSPPGSWSQVPLAGILPSIAEGGVLKVSGPVYYGGPSCLYCDVTIAPRDLVPYAVEVDQSTGDGFFAAFEPPSFDADRRSLFLPALVRDSSGLSSDLRLGRGEDAVEAQFVELTFRGVIGGERKTVIWQEALRADAGVRLDAAAAVVAHAGLNDDGQPVNGTLAIVPDLTWTRSCFGATRVTTTVPGYSGTVGATIAAIPAGRFASSKAIVPGLADDESLRSSLALANPEPDSGPTEELYVTLVRGSDGIAVGSASIALPPGARWESDVRALVPNGSLLGNLHAVIRNAGAGRFVAYGVVYERSSGDGAERPMTSVE